MKNVVFRAFIIGLIGLLIAMGAFFVIGIMRYMATLELEPIERMERVSVLIDDGIVSENTGDFDMGSVFARSAVVGIVSGIVVFGIALLICTLRYKHTNKPAPILPDKPIQPFGTSESNADPSTDDINELKKRLKDVEQKLNQAQRKHYRPSFDSFKTEAIDYNCTHYFINGFVISAVITFFVFIFLCAIIELAPISEVFFLSLELAVYVGVSVGIYCIIYAIYKGSKEQIERLQYQSQKILQQHQERIAMLEYKLDSITATDCNKDPRGRGDS